MIKKLLQFNLFVIFVFYSTASSAQDSLVLKSFIGNKVRILLPSSFRTIPPDSIAIEYPGLIMRPSVILRNETESFKIIETGDDLNDTQLVEYKYFKVKGFKESSNTKLVNEGMKRINGKRVGYIKAIYTENGSFAYFFFITLYDKLILFIYNCPEQIWQTLEARLEKMVNSLKIE
jgi:hypothetical protein